MFVALDYQDDATLSLVIGNQLNTITADCFSFSNAIVYRICPTEICGDGIDNDEDGDTDCLDSDCPIPTGTAAFNSPLCLGDNLALDETGGDPSIVRWDWSGPSGYTASNIKNPGIGSVSTSNAGTYTVTVTNATGCTATSTIDVVLSNLPVVNLTLVDMSYCVSTGTLPLSGGDPVGGTYSGAGVSSNNFDAAVAGIGAHIITYTYSDGTCSNSATDEIEVFSLPVVSLALSPNTNCINNTVLSLSGGNPSGGVYSGTGVTGGNFNATAAGLGVHTITYTYTDGNNCINTATDDLTVIDLPAVTLALPDVDECLNSNTLTLSGESPSGGTFSGTGVTGTNFDASVAGVGVHTIVYSITDINGCTNSATNSIIVHNPPNVDLDLPDHEDCILNTIFPLSGGTPTTGSYTGTGVSGTNFDASVAGLGWHIITYSYTDGNGCSGVSIDSINVISIPNVTLNLPTIEACIDETNIALSGGIPSGGSYSGTGVSGTTFDPSTAGAGTHSITYLYTDANGCNNSTTDDIIIYGLPSISGITPVNPTSCSGTDGTITLTASGGTSSYQYRINGGTWQASNSFSGLSSGNYNAEVQNDNGYCMSSYTSNPIVLSDPSSPLAEINLPGASCVNETASFIATDAGVGAIYNWDFGTGATPTTASGIGPHAVTYSSAANKNISLDVTLVGCVSSDNETFTVNALPTVILSLPDTEECLSSTTLTLSGGSPSGGTPPATYTGTGVSGTNFDASVAGLGTHTMTYTYTNANGCVNTATDDIIVHALPVVDLTLGIDEFCISTTSTLITGGTPTGGVYSGTGVGLSNFDPSSAGAGTHLISYTYTDANGCINTATDNITVYDFPTIDNVNSNSPTSCSGTEGSISIAASGATGNYEYRLNGGTWQASNTFTNLASGNYNVAIRNDNDFCELSYTSNPVILTDPPTTIVTTAVTSDYTGEDISCVGASDGFAVAEGSGGTGPYTYLWDNSQTGDTLRNITAGTYTVLVTDAVGCQGTGSVTLNDPPPLGVTAVFTNPTCYGASDGAIDVTATGGVGAYTYAWNDLGPIAFYPFDGTTEDISGNNHDAVAVWGSETYSNDAVDGQSFEFENSTGIKLDDGVFLDIPFSQRSVFMDVKPEPGNGKYILYEEGGRDNGIAIGIKNGRLEGAVVHNGIKINAFRMNIPDDGNWHEVGFVYNNGWIRLYVDGVAGWPMYTFSGTVQINSVNNTNDAGLGDAFGNHAFQNENYDAYEGLMDNVAIYDYPFDQAVVGGTGNDSSGGDRTGIPAGEYQVYVYDLNGCIDSISLTLTQPDSLALTWDITEVSCNGGNDASIDLTVAGGTPPYIYSWGNGENVEDIGSLTQGTYPITVTDDNGCAVEGDVIVNEPPVLNASAFVTSDYNGFDLTCPGATDGTATATPSGGSSPYTYLWSNNQTNSNLINVGAGSYTVTVTDSRNCTTITTVSLVNPPGISVSTNVISDFAGEDISCAGASDGRARATAVAGIGSYNYSWSNGSSGAILDGVTAGTYFVTATDANGCSATSSVTLNDPPAISIVTTVTSGFNGADVSCAGATDGSADATASGGGGGFNYIWSNTQTGTDLTGVGAGTYTVTATDANGCTTTETVTLNNPTNVDVSIAITSNYNGFDLSCEDGTDGILEATGSGGVGPYRYIWNNLETTPTISNLSAGTYTVTVADLNSCLSVTSIEITAPTEVSMTLSPTPPTDCGIDNGRVVITASGGVGNYEYSIDGTNYYPSGTFNGLAAGTYFGYVRNTFGSCIAGPQSTLVTFPEAPIIDNITVINPTTSSSLDGGILVTASGDGIVIEYSIDGTNWQTSNLFTGLDEGLFTIQIRYTGFNCIATSTVTLTAGGGVVGSGGGENFCSGDLAGVNFVEIYYIPFPEDQMLTSLQTVFPDACGGSDVRDPIQTYVSIGVVEDASVIIYDHWEDGFELSLAYPIQPTTEIWGDGNPSNGMPPGYAVDILNAADIIVLNNSIVSTTRAAVIDFDGGDKIGSRGNLAMTRMGWGSGPNNFLAGALEVYATPFWGTRYDIPVGPNTDVNEMFEYTAAIIMAQEANTLIEIDGNNDGFFEVQVTRNEGESYLMNSGLGSGGVIRTSSPTQVHLLTGDICHTYEARWFTLKPTDQWSDSYFNPVATANNNGNTHIDFVNAPTYVHLFNGNSTDIVVNWKQRTGPPIAVNVFAGQTAVIEIPDNTGTHFYSSGGEPFYAVATIDSDEFGNNARNDWGFALTPESALSPQITLVGFAPGSIPTYPNTENSAPVWLTAAYPAGNTSTAEIKVCIDYNGDGGSLPDINGIMHDDAIFLDPLENAKIYDADGDQTGMRIWVCDGGGGIIAGAWGQDPVSVNTEGDALDLGVGLPNGIPFAATKCVDLSRDYNSNGLYDECDEAIYTIEIRNTGVLPLSVGSLTTIDTLPTEVTYIDNTTSTIVNGVVSSLPDNGGAVSPFPLDENGFIYNTIIQAGDSLILRFEVSINDLPSAAFVSNRAHINVGSQTLLPEVSFPVEEPTGPILYGILPDTLVNCDALPAPPVIGTDIIVINNCEEMDTIDQSLWTVHFVNSEELASETAPATNAFDDNPNTYWHTNYSGSSPTHPHEIQIDLGATYNVTGFRYLPRQNSANGRIEDFEFYVTADISNWGSPQISGSWANDNGEEEEIFNIARGRYVRIVANSEINGNPWASIAELDVLQCINYSPSNIVYSETSTQTNDGSSTDDCYVLTRTWEATDHCGQISTSTQMLTVQDTIAPILINVPTDIEVTTRSIPDPPLLNCASLGNIAFGRPTSQSSTAAGGNAANAVDGNTDGDFANGSVSQTLTEPEAWWEVDLESTQSIDSIAIWNRTDCCAGTLSNYYIFVSSFPFASTDVLTTIGDTEVTTFFESAQANSPTFIPIDTTARYIRIQLQGTGTLNLTEVNVIPTCISATDNCDADVAVSYSQVIGPGSCSYDITRTWTATDNCGNIESQTQIITVNSILEIDVVRITSDFNGEDISCPTAADGETEIEISGAIAPVSINWSNGQSGLTATGLIAGTYYVTVSDGNGCIAQDSITLQAPSAIDVTASITSDHNGRDVSCYGSNDGSAFVLALGGVGTLNYNWSTGGTTPTINDLLAGKYIVTISDANGCIAIDSVTLVNPPVVDLTASVPSDYHGEDISCPGANDGSATATASGGTGVINYTWSNSEMTATANGLIAGSYTITATDVNGCIDTSRVTLTDPPIIVIAIDATTNPTVCEASNGSITVSATGGSNNYEFRLGLSGTWQSTTTFGGLVAGTYDIYARNADDTCEVGPTSVTLTDPIPQACPAVADLADTLVCNTNVNVIFNVPMVAAATGYTWTVSPGINIVSGQGTNSLVVDMNEVSVGFYSICVITNSNCGNSPLCCTDIEVETCNEICDNGLDDDEDGLTDCDDPDCQFTSLINIGDTSCVSTLEIISVDSVDVGTTYDWDFGINATPATATGFGDHSVTYSTPGIKYISVDIINNGCSITLNDSIYIESCNASIGDFVWQDDNENGIQDVGELGIEGVIVSLYDNTNTFISNATTGADGSYIIDSVVLGTYYLTFDVSTNTNGILIYQGTQQNAGSPLLDSDPNPATGRTPLFYFEPGLGDILTLDAGFILSCPPDQRGGVIVTPK